MRRVGDLFVLVAVGVILAEVVTHPGPVSTIFCQIGNVWGTAMSGMLGQQHKSQDCSKAAAQATGPKPPASQKQPATPNPPGGCRKCCFFVCICCPSWLP